MRPLLLVLFILLTGAGTVKIVKSLVESLPKQSS